MWIKINLTWISNYIHYLVWNYLSIPKLQLCKGWSLDMDTLRVCYYLSMLGLKLIHVSKRSPRYLVMSLHRISTCRSDTSNVRWSYGYEYWYMLFKSVIWPNDIYQFRSQNDDRDSTFLIYIHQVFSYIIEWLWRIKKYIYILIFRLPCLGRQTRHWQIQLMFVINKLYLIAIPSINPYWNNPNSNIQNVWR